jgi:hypothetical protein
MTTLRSVVSAGGVKAKWTIRASTYEVAVVVVLAIVLPVAH